MNLSVRSAVIWTPRQMELLDFSILKPCAFLYTVDECVFLENQRSAVRVAVKRGVCVQAQDGCRAGFGDPPRSVALTAFAFVFAGTMQKTALGATSVGIVHVSACVGTSLSLAKQPRSPAADGHVSSSSTTLTAFLSLK